MCYKIRDDSKAIGGFIPNFHEIPDLRILLRDHLGERITAPCL